MNLNTYTPSAKVLKKLANYASGQPVTTKDVPHIAVIVAAEVIDSKKIVEAVVSGIKNAGGIVFVHYVSFMGYANRINPMTAKFADSFRTISMSNAQAIIKTNMVDGVVIVTDCDVTCAGLLDGASAANCPVMVMPLGTCAYSNFLEVAGNVTAGRLISTEVDDMIKNLPMLKYQTSFFRLLENLGICVATASTTPRESGAQIINATETGKQAVSVANDIKTPRKVFTKSAWESVVDFALVKNTGVAGLHMLMKLFNANDVKTPYDFIGERIGKLANPNVKVARVTGTAIGGGGYVRLKDKPVSGFSGKAWVYQNLEDADNALLGGNIPKHSVIVVQNCVGMNISSLVYALRGMGLENDIAIATDGICDADDVLMVTMITPNSFANEEFANIQTGDTLDIDVAKGRFNSNVLAKDVKNRAKRNAVTKPKMYF